MPIRLFVLLALGFAACPVASETELILPRDAALCLAENAEAYLSDGLDPIVIVVAACPEADMAAALAARSSNSGLLDISGGDPVIVLSRDEVRCVAEARDAIRAAGDPVTLSLPARCAE